MLRPNASFSSSSRWAMAALGALWLAGAPAVALAAPGCLDTALQAPSPSRALAMATFAVQEHEGFGGQTMDAEGRMTVEGDSEAEDTRRTVPGLAPWQRVVGYWQAVDPQLPSRVRYGALRPAYRQLLMQALNEASAARLQGMGVGPDEGLDTPELRAVDVALKRVAVIDTPWSAAFISWLARQAGLADDEFVFSEAHVDYAGAAWQAGVQEQAGRPTRYAMRACDLTRTPPRIGDLVCQARGAGAELDTFDKIGEVLATRPTGGDALPMHCDVVVAVDATGFDTVGGNVLQSVTRRRLDFAQGTRWLDRSYLPEGCTPGAAGCIDRHMSRQPWSLLLQWR
ncbi:DUF2272 domain-containing protein [Variovorax sp. E3]|uniref:DUF2272 domain-containing protein n=1 Tax=Variovorax sp. E3 TaxID=1914993 RepID=UPI0022B69D34|nr:DUF2272 domain-containing protein [Variovorax sp. E3]